MCVRCLARTICERCKRIQSTTSALAGSAQQSSGRNQTAQAASIEALAAVVTVTGNEGPLTSLRHTVVGSQGQVPAFGGRDQCWRRAPVDVDVKGKHEQISCDRRVAGEGKDDQ